MGVYGKPKNTLEARQDLQRMKERENLHPEKVDDGRQYLCLASYTLSREEKENMFECLNSIKVPSGFFSNVKGIINVPEKKFVNLKSHDTIASGHIERDSTSKYTISHYEIMCIPQCNFLDGIQSSTSSEPTEGRDPMSCQL
jgi:hypothetical protein